MKKIIDKEYCMSSFLTYRYIAKPNVIFGDGIVHKEIDLVEDSKKYACQNAREIDFYIKKMLNDIDLNHSAILLSGGIDSGILASYMPKGTRAYTVASPNPASIYEIKRAAQVCEKYGLHHIIVNVTWSDYLECMDLLMENDGCPVFANEPQVYTLAKQVKEDGIKTIIYGDNADMAFGGMDKLLSKDWTFDEWVERYTFLNPNKVLKNPVDVLDTYEQYRNGDNGIDYIKFLDEVFAMSSSGAYINAFCALNIEYFDPYAYLKMREPLDLERVRNGDSKYLLRELYKMKFPNFEIPEKIAMARAVDIWLKDWAGPVRSEFRENCIAGLTGEQKFLVYSLERFLDLMGIR